jgi:RecB family endonuclease NucS
VRFETAALSRGREGVVAMNRKSKPYIWQMIREAVEALGGKTTNAAIRDWIMEYYPNTSVNKIQSQIVVCTVNHPSRIHYAENQQPRRADGPYDFLYRPAPGRVEAYDPRMHGTWEIDRDAHGFLTVRKSEHGIAARPEEIAVDSSLVEQNHLLSYLTKHLDIIEPGLELFVDETGNDGIRYETDIGPIDILAIDREGGYVVVKLKPEGGREDSSAQILGFRNWVKRHLANGNRVRGYLIGPRIPDPVRYALVQSDDVFLKEYELNITLKDVPRI